VIKVPSLRDLSFYKYPFHRSDAFTVPCNEDRTTLLNSSWLILPGKDH